MLGHDVARSGATADEIRPPFERKWYRAFVTEGVNAGVQPVVANGKVYIGTLGGYVHAIDAETGEDAWAWATHSPVLHSCAVADGRVFCGTADGNVWALDAEHGTKRWTVQTGAAVWNAPCPFDGVVYVGSRDGKLYAIDEKDGAVRWTASTGGPLLGSPAIDVKNKRVVVGSEDMHVYAFDAANGKQAWRSDKLPGCSLRGYHAVVAPDGSIIITAQPFAGGDAMQQVLLDMVKEVFGDFASWRHKDKAENDRLQAQNFEQLKDPQTYAKEMAYLRKRLTDEPALQTLFTLDGATGAQKFVTPVVYAESMNGPCTPPVVTPDGKVIVKYSALLRSRYGHYSPFLNVGYLDTKSGDIAPLMDESRTYGWNDSLLLVHDEMSQLSVGGRVLFNTHQDNVNALDLDTLKGYPFPLANNVHEPQPGWTQAIWSLYLTRGQNIPRGYEWFARGTAVYGGGSAVDVPIAISGDSFYYLPTHELSAGCCLVAYRMQKDGKASERGPEPKEKFTAAQWDWVKRQGKWDWDTLGIDRLKSTVATFPEKVPGTTAAPLTGEAKAAVAKISDDELDKIIFERLKAAEKKDAAPSEAAVKARVMLARSVDELISTTWQPLQFPAAKAPSEAYRFFIEPTETLYTLALAYPHLPPELRRKVRKHVEQMQAPGGPLDGPVGRATYDSHGGQVRSAYDAAPESLLNIGQPLLRSDTARLYPLWLWAQRTDDWKKLQSNWPKLRALVNDKPAPDEADCGNGRVAGLIAACRIGNRADDVEFVKTWLPRTRQAMRDRLVYELAHTEGGVITRHRLQPVLGRWHFLTPDVAQLCATYAQPVERHLVDVYLDYHRPTWWLAWNVELLPRNEAPMSFPTVAQDGFAAKAMIVGEKPETLYRYLDLPWCQGDETYVQKLAMILDAAGQQAP